jgi:polyketide cyclase/dehydrase/lipid transport protein
MASIRKEMSLRARPDAVWDAVRDVGAIHTRLAPDFVTDTRLEGDARIVTFANGMTAKELIVDVDDQTRRLVWAVVEGRPRHHNGSIQILPAGEGCRLIWIADLLPNELAPAISGMMQHGMEAMKRKLDGGAS